MSGRGNGMHRYRRCAIVWAWVRYLMPAQGDRHGTTQNQKALKLASFNESKSICFRFNWVCCLKWENVTCAKAVKRPNSEKSSLDLTIKWKQFKCLSNTDRTIKAATAAALALVEVTERSDVLWNTFSTLGNHAHEQSLIEFEPRKPKSASITVDVDIQQF